MNLSVLTPRNIEAMIFQQLNQPPDQTYVDALCGPIKTTNQESESYFDVGSVPAMSELKGGRPTNNVRPIGPWVVTNRLFGVAMRVHKNELDLDKTGQVQQRIDDLTGRFNQHWDDLAIRRIKGGTTTACYDGQFYHSTTHQEGDSPTQSNSITSASGATPSTPTATAYQDAIFKAITQMNVVVDDTGYPAYRSQKDFVLVVPPSHLKSVAGALNTTAIPGGAGESNVLVSYGKYTFQVVDHPLLATTVGGAAWTDKFAIFAKDGRALMRQHQKGWEKYIQTKDVKSDLHYDTFMLEYGLSSMRELTYGDWKGSVLVTFT